MGKKSLLVVVAAISCTCAQPNPCDDRLKQSLSDPQGYRLRGDCCEGLYIREVAGSSSLGVASFTQAFEDFDTSSGGALQLAWNSPVREPVRIRAVGLRSKLYYRMDAVRPGAEHSYRWSTDVLAQLRMERKDVGVVGWTSYNAGGRKVDLYLPLRIQQRGGTAASNGYQLVLWPGAELEEVYLTLAPVGADGRRGGPLLKGKPLGYGYYPAERGLDVPVSGLKEPGVYVLDIGATLKGGGPSSLQVWFYHAGN